MCTTTHRDRSVWRPRQRALRRSGINRLAIASLICGLAGIPLFGIVTGMVAVVLGVLALAAIRGTCSSGACAGPGRGGAGDRRRDRLDHLAGGVAVETRSRRAVQRAGSRYVGDRRARPALQRAMRANVVIERRGGLAALGGEAIGSGVILEISGERP